MHSPSKKPYQIRNAEIIPLFELAEQKCSACKLIKPACEFVKDKYRKGGVRPFCKKCKNQRALEPRRKWRIDNKEKNRDYEIWDHRKRKFGLSKDDYFSLIAKQNNSCAICKNTFPNVVAHKLIHIDHCHKTGKVRGLLCQKCNHGIGMFLDSITICRDAALYLEKHNGS